MNVYNCQTCMFVFVYKIVIVYCYFCLHVHKSSKIIERMKIYAKYCNNYDAAEALYKQKLKKREFETFVNVSRHPLLLVLVALFLGGGRNVRRPEQPG